MKEVIANIILQLVSNTFLRSGFATTTVSGQQIRRKILLIRPNDTKIVVSAKITLTHPGQTSENTILSDLI